MTQVLRNVLIIGGGFSGMAAALELSRIGVAVDLVELDPSWRPYGAGISLGGAALRALARLGVLEDFLARAHAADGVELRAPHGTPLAMLPTPRLAGPGVPGGAGVMRPVLAGILADALRRSTTRLRLGCSFTALEEEEDGVRVRFTDGSTGKYDLVIGADGLYSAVRQAVFPDAPKPLYSGQGVWRALLPRLPGIETTTMWIGPRIKPGVNPVSGTEMYLFITEDRATNAWMEPQGFVAHVRGLLGDFPDPVLQEIRARLDEKAQIIYRPLEGLLMRGPWHRGRVVLIGDAVHATTPHLASGACIGLEDAIVLAEEVGRGGPLTELLARFQARRWERCRMVVENSARLGEIEKTGGDKAEHARIMRESLHALAEPI